ncbi:lipopolysaccharide transport periplasmic protein LptA [Psychrosphaera aestuarii]|uniref:lipopolysaccharide transport periplasmic protein LptA n=1 Tax=Psychrosphaera aestuarii TaxID=1266052 RepID=UPI001B321390|nr:lipopolysaccharide transport periplasmic protein LptA [Psychrosphaera aestuarii]
MTKFIKMTLVILACIGLNAFANDDLIIDSKNQDLDYKNNTMYFSGNVKIQQGTLTITADELYVITKDGVGEKLIAKGKPARFLQNDPNNEALEATALEVVYMINERILELNGQAKYKQGSSIVESGNIVFDLNAQRVKADGDKSTGGRVTTTIKTKKTQPNN